MLSDECATTCTPVWAAADGHWGGEIGAQTLVLDPLEGLDDEKSGREDYVSVMTANLANLRTGLGCR